VVQQNQVAVGAGATAAPTAVLSTVTALAAAGATFADIVKTTTYITDLAHRQALREVRIERLGHLAAPPANTALVVSSLIEPEFLVEVDVVAAVPLG
jgi:enamine deaminase RidA (YjgF/YER057c/UK114 family)